MRRVYIIILNYKKWKDVTECLETLFRSHYNNFSVIVIDNHSENDSLDHLAHWAENSTIFSNRLSYFSKDTIRKPVCYQRFDAGAFANGVSPQELPRLVLLQNTRNRGFAGGINPVLQFLACEDAYIWLLNPDMVVEESTLSHLAAFARENPTESIIGSVIKYYTNPAKIYLYAGGKINFNTGTVRMMTNRNELASMDYVSGGSLFTYAQNFRNIGLLPENYFLYWEETDWCYHARKNGYRLVLCEEAVCYDKISSTIGKSFLADYYYTRNGLQFLSKYKKEKIPVALFFTVFRVLKKLASGQPARARGVYKGMLSFLKKAGHENQ